MLDAGCGPGRFAIHMAQSGYSLTLVDISQHQLDQARDHLEAAGLLARVQAFHCLDILDLHSLHDASFDAVVCYGGAISYTYDRYKAALEELARVVRPGGVLLISVFSLYGSYRLIGPYDGVDALMPPEEHIDWQAMLTGADVLLSNPESNQFHQRMALFTSSGLRRSLEAAGLQVVEMATSNPVVSEGAQIPKISASEEASSALTELELALCTRSGLLDAGEHLIAVARKG